MIFSHTVGIYIQPYIDGLEVEIQTLHSTGI
jgi:hypothetical protein